MDEVTYNRFTDELIEWANRDSRVVGLVALGSMAGGSRVPDEWSDHDFWVVANEADAEALRAERDWLPDSERIVVHFVDTEHGRSAIYDDGHLVEYAVFRNSELEIARANAFRVLVDRCDLENRMVSMAQRTAAAVGSDPTGESQVGRLLSQIVIGANRFGRGEVLSANSLIRGAATTTLLGLVSRFVPPRAICESRQSRSASAIRALVSIARRDDRILVGSIASRCHECAHSRRTPDARGARGVANGRFDRCCRSGRRASCTVMPRPPGLPGRTAMLTERFYNQATRKDMQ